MSLGFEDEGEGPQRFPRIEEEDGIKTRSLQRRETRGESSWKGIGEKYDEAAFGSFSEFSQKKL